jgi:hypothetical protein
MSILPVGATPPADEAIQPSRTYRIDFDTGRIAGMADGVDAVRQAIYKIIDTERFAHDIYSSGYGRERGPVSELQDYITAALLQDDRITTVEDFRYTATGDSAMVTLTAVTIYGVIPVERRAEVYV